MYTLNMTVAIQNMVGTEMMGLGAYGSSVNPPEAKLVVPGARRVKSRGELKKESGGNSLDFCIEIKIRTFHPMMIQSVL